MKSAGRFCSQAVEDAALHRRSVAAVAVPPRCAGSWKARTATFLRREDHAAHVARQGGGTRGGVAWDGGDLARLRHQPLSTSSLGN
jgi:hypothetical protein